MSGFARIWNLDDLNTWSAGGTDAKPRFEFTASCPSGHSISEVQIKIYDASTAGNLVQTHTLTGATLATALAAGYYDSSYGMKNKDQASNERWWTIKSTCSNGDTSGESSRTGFKVCWGQALYEYAVPGGALSAGWSFASATTPTNTEAAFLFRNATGASGAGAGAWKESIGEVTPAAYVNVLVRLSTYVAGTQPTLSDMTFSYSASATQPDNWAFSPSGDWFIDPSKYRYGTKSLKFVVDDASDRYIYPFTLDDGDDIVVQPNTAYVFSAWVKTDGALDSGCELRLEIYAGGGLTTLLAQGTLAGDSLNDGPGATTDTSPYSEGWQRLHLRFNSGSTTEVRPVVRYDNDGGGSGDAGWIDATQFEEGLVVSPWHASTLSNAGVLDSYGLILDALAGARVYARASDGETANLDDIVHAAAAGGGGGGLTNLEGGSPTSTYGGTTAVDGGAP